MTTCLGKQGGESCDLLWLFCSCIRTERVRILYIAFLILNKFLSGKMQIPCLRKQQTNVRVFHVTLCNFLRNLEQRLSVFARGCVEKKQRAW